MTMVWKNRLPPASSKPNAPTRGRPVARLVPVGKAPAGVFGRMRGTAEISGDIVAPVGERWEADQ